MPAVKPKLEKLSTPLSATLPSEMSASMATPLSAVHLLCKPDPDFIKTPISSPLAYTDFLTRAMSLGSPSLPCDGRDTPTSASSAAAEFEASSNADDDSSLPSSPSLISATAGKETPSTVASAVVSPTPCTPLVPMSAPPIGAASFSNFKLPPSPAISILEPPLSACTVRSPFSARSVRPVFDWDAALKALFAELTKHKSSRNTVRHIREVVTRTVTYTPKMKPAPRGKLRKVE